MNNLFKKRTVIVIAHRLQTVKTAHEIIVIDDWTIVERWNHEELILLGWAYAHMLEIQTWF
jgi:ABC-type multidrug transport system fused ATPase/permease subunit